MSRFAPGWTFRETCCDSGSSLGTVGCVLAVVILTRLVRNGTSCVRQNCHASEGGPLMMHSQCQCATFVSGMHRNWPIGAPSGPDLLMPWGANHVNDSAVWASTLVFAHSPFTSTLQPRDPLSHGCDSLDTNELATS